MIILGIESSCDDTSCAILNNGKLLSNIVSSQHQIHNEFGGIVPELASRQHVKSIIPVLDKALLDANVTLDQIDAVAVTASPGLMGSLLVGLNFAKGLALALNKPLIGINHLEAHLHAACIENPELTYPFIGLVVSGGHTSLYHAVGLNDYKLIGATRDDAAGEVFDKIAVLMGLGHPGGPAIDRLANYGESDRFKFTQPKIGKKTKYQIGGADFSFSGIKTACRNYIDQIKKESELTDQDKKDLSASFQKSVVDSLVDHVLLASKRYDCKKIVISGGVACNSELRRRMKNIGDEKSLSVFIPSPILCTDNAGMIAYLGWRYALEEAFSDLSLIPKAVDELGI